MSKAQEVVRIFKISDAEMIQTSRIYHGLFSQDRQQFINLDPDFGDPFPDNWMAAIVESESVLRDMDVRDEIAQFTGNVRHKMDECRTHFQKMKYYIEKAFPNNKAVWNAFGYEDYDSARLSEVQLLPFMKNLKTQASKNAAKLIAANYKQADIDKIGTLWQELLEADQAQESYKKERVIITQQRIEKLNAAWEYVLKVNKASKNIFADNYAKLQQYILPGESAPEEPEQTAASATQQPA